MMSAATPRARNPSLVSATCSAVLGGGSRLTASVSAARPSQARAAALSVIRRSRNTASVWFL